MRTKSLPYSIGAFKPKDSNLTAGRLEPQILIRRPAAKFIPMLYVSRIAHQNLGGSAFVRRATCSVSYGTDCNIHTNAPDSGY